MNAAKLADWKENRDLKVEAARSMLANAVASIQSGPEWASMLQNLARGGRFSLRRLSFRNQLLVAMQRPDATRVATYGAWQRAGRQVRKGERSIVILAPIIVSKKKEGSDEAESVLVGFKPHAVFAGEQTDAASGGRGKPLPEPVQVTRDVTAPEVFENSVETLREVCLGLGKDVVTAIDLRPRQPGDHVGAHGWYDRGTRSIVVVTGERERSHEFKTLLHEVVHAILHGGDDHHARPEMEVEAESAAFVVASVVGLDTSSYSFGYVAAWAGSDDAQAMVLRSGQRIVKAVNVILDALLGADSESVEQQAA